MSIGRIVGILSFEDLLSAESVDEGGTSCLGGRSPVNGCFPQMDSRWIRTSSAGTTDHQTELDTLLDIFLATELDL